MLKKIVTCRSCGRRFEIQFEFEDYENWCNGTLIQDAFPYLTADERELLKTQTCGLCWERMFSFGV